VVNEGSKIFLVGGALSGFLSVALGAFGAHALKDRLAPEMLAVFETGVRYQFFHTFALFVVGWAIQKYPAENFSPAGWCFVAGILLFSGSLYTLALTGMRWLGAVTPFGGLAFLAGWLWLAWQFWKVR
jgi:uncharacterized membrane protein YgdD (TMEM256/DUF423 family)